MSRLLVGLVVLLVLGAGCTFSVETEAPGSRTTPESSTVTVTNVIDGDTMDVQFSDGTVDTIRLLGVDVPETRADVTPEEFEGVPNTEAGREWLREWGDRATAFAADRLDGQRVRIVGDPLAEKRGGYGRLLVYLYHNGTLFNRVLLERGYARLYDSPFTKRDAFASAQAAAQGADRGIWGFDTRTTAAREWLRTVPGYSRLVAARAVLAQSPRGL